MSDFSQAQHLRLLKLARSRRLMRIITLRLCKVTRDSLLPFRREMLLQQWRGIYTC